MITHDILKESALAFDEFAPFIQRAELVTNDEGDEYISIAIEPSFTTQHLTDNQKYSLSRLATVSTINIFSFINGKLGNKMLKIITNLSRKYKLKKSNWYIHTINESPCKTNRLLIYVGIINEEEYKELNYLKYYEDVAPMDYNYEDTCETNTDFDIC